MYTVKEVAKKVGITTHTVRYYTDQNLIPGVLRDKNNNRLFDKECLGWLKGVVFLKEGGMSIKQIREYIDLCLEGDSTILKRYNIVNEQYKLSLLKLQEAQKTVEYMENKVNSYKELIETNNDHMNPINWSSKDSN